MDLPDRGSLVWLLFSPQAGSEQAGRRPGIVLTPLGYHQRSRLAIVCPITSRERGWPTEVKLPPGLHPRISSSAIMQIPPSKPLSRSARPPKRSTYSAKTSSASNDTFLKRVSQSGRFCHHSA